MIDVEYHELEFTTWECNKANVDTGSLQLEPVMRIQSVLDPCTRVKIGLYFQHRINLCSQKGLILRCIAAHVFISPGICCYSFSQIKELVQTAHHRFQNKLLERATAEQIPFTLDCAVNDADVELVMQQVNNNASE